MKSNVSLMHFMKVRTGSVLIIMHSFVEKILFIRSTHLMCLKVLSYNLRKKVRSGQIRIAGADSTGDTTV